MSMKVITKGILGLFTMLLFTIIASGIVHADLIFEPNDDFYYRHSKDCENVERNFTANGPKGNIIVWESPESDKKVDTYVNGTKFSVSYTYTDENNKTWGLVTTNDYTGWVKMKETRVVYDVISFCEEHKGEFQDYKNEFDDYIIGDPIVLWSYPGSGEVTGKIDKLFTNFNFVYVYTDENGQKWGYCADTSTNHWKSRWGYQANWICISDPTNELLPVIEPKQPSIIPTSPANQASNTSEGQGNSGIIFLTIAVALLILITAIVIRVNWKKGPTNEKPQ